MTYQILHKGQVIYYTTFLKKNADCCTSYFQRLFRSQLYTQIRHNIGIGYSQTCQSYYFRAFSFGLANGLIYCLHEENICYNQKRTRSSNGPRFPRGAANRVCL